MKVCYNTNLPFLNNPKDLDPSNKTDLDLWDCFRRKIIPSYNRRNTVVKGQSSETGRVLPLYICPQGPTRKWSNSGETAPEKQSVQGLHCVHKFQPKAR